MSEEEFRDLESPTDGQVSAKATPNLRILGAAMVGAAVWRGWSDAQGLMTVLRWTQGRLFSVPWFDHIGVLWALWPLLIGVGLVATRSSKLLKAATIACLALASERVIFLGFGVFLDQKWGWSTDPEVSRTLLNVAPKGFALLVPVASASVWLALGVICTRLQKANRPEKPTVLGPDRAIRGIVGRLAVVVSLVFAFGLVGNEGWNLFLEVLQRFPSVRRMILRSGYNHEPRIWTAAEALDNERYHSALDLVREGLKQQNEGNFPAAWEAYAGGLSLYQKLANANPMDENYRNQVALASNNLAWFLVTWPDKSCHAPKSAIPLARAAVDLNPTDGNAWNTLGVAFYRDGDIENAIDAFKTSNRYRQGGDSFDWYFQAMIAARRHRLEAAQFYYDKALAWAEKFRSEDLELLRFRDEAATMLGIPVPPPKPEIAKVADGAPGAASIHPLIPSKGFSPFHRRRGR